MLLQRRVRVSPRYQYGNSCPQQRILVVVVYEDCQRFLLCLNSQSMFRVGKGYHPMITNLTPAMVDTLLVLNLASSTPLGASERYSGRLDRHASCCFWWEPVDKSHVLAVHWSHSALFRDTPSFLANG